jgi:macrophage erythroblast attacher
MTLAATLNSSLIRPQMQLTTLLKSFSGDPDKDKEPALTKLDALSDRVRGLKRKLDDLQPSPGAPSALRERISYVDDSLLNKGDNGTPMPETETESDESTDGVLNGASAVGNGTKAAGEKRSTRTITVPPKPPVYVH